MEMMEMMRMIIVMVVMLILIMMVIIGDPADDFVYRSDCRIGVWNQDKQGFWPTA